MGNTAGATQWACWQGQEGGGSPAGGHADKGREGQEGQERDHNWHSSAVCGSWQPAAHMCMCSVHARVCIRCAAPSSKPSLKEAH